MICKYNKNKLNYQIKNELSLPKKSFTKINLTFNPLHYFISIIRRGKASQKGLDKAVCGDCKLRHYNNGACYVTLHHAPLAVWKSYHKGNYKQLNGDYSVFEGLNIRFGAYGDPYAIPLDILIQIKSRVKNNTSYTHQWKTEPNSVLKTMSMASADNLTEAKEAQSMGWRTFRVATMDSDIMKNEIVCPNYTKGINCLDCGLCNGTTIKAKNIVIPVHGTKKKKFAA